MGLDGVGGCCLLIALILGAVIGTLRTLPDRPWIVRLGNAWVELFRNIPLLVQVFIWYHVIPAMIPSMKSLPGFVLVVFAIDFYFGTYCRAGAPRYPGAAVGQRHAGMAMGFYNLPDLSLCAAHGVSHHHSAADQRGR
ncbi:ABC transporter permease subunit [Staphylococcus epidermidis]|nr:ABC transporter permease subunit [Staphylococcus epidermidis]